MDAYLSLTPTQKAIIELLIFLSSIFKRLTISQETIAKKLGRSRETVNRLLQHIPRSMIRRTRIKDHKLTRYETKHGFKYYKKDRYTEYTIDPVWKKVYEGTELRSVLQRFEGLTPNFLNDLTRISKKTFLKLWNGSYFSEKCHTIQACIFTRYRTNKGNDRVRKQGSDSFSSENKILTGDEIFLQIQEKLLKAA